jgi:hypothetical protein
VASEQLIEAPVAVPLLSAQKDRLFTAFRGNLTIIDWALRERCCIWARAVREPYAVCAEQVRQLEGESPFDNLMEVIVLRRREIVRLHER